MYIEQLLFKRGIFRWFKRIFYYCFLSWCSLVSIPMPFVEAKTKKTAVQDDPAQDKKHKKESKKDKGKFCDIIAYTSLCLENPRKLGKYNTFYHQGAHFIGLNINKIDITSHADVMCSIYAGKRLKSFTEDSQKATWSLMQRYCTAQLLAERDYNCYQNYKKDQGNHASYNDGILTGVLTNAIVNSIQAAKFKEDDAIFRCMLPYMAGLYGIKKQVQLSKINVVMLATTAPVLCEPVVW